MTTRMVIASSMKQKSRSRRSSERSSALRKIWKLCKRRLLHWRSKSQKVTTVVPPSIRIYDTGKRRGRSQSWKRKSMVSMWKELRKPKEISKQSMGRWTERGQPSTARSVSSVVCPAAELVAKHSAIASTTRW